MRVVLVTITKYVSSVGVPTLVTAQIARNQLTKNKH